MGVSNGLSTTDPAAALAVKVVVLVAGAGSAATAAGDGAGDGDGAGAGGLLLLLLLLSDFSLNLFIILPWRGVAVVQRTRTRGCLSLRGNGRGGIDSVAWWLWW